MAKTISQLSSQARTIRNATQSGENTAERVGGLFSDIVDYLNDISSSGGGGGNVGLSAPLDSINGLGTPYASGMGLVWDGSNWGFGQVGPTEESGITQDQMWQSLGDYDEGRQIDPSHLTNAFNSAFENLLPDKLSEKMSGFTWWGRSFEGGNNALTGSLTGVEDLTMTGLLSIGGFQIEKDENGNLKFNGSIYATGGITALGDGEGSGEEGNVALNHPLSDINTANLGNPSENGQVIMWDADSASWVYGKASGSGDIQWDTINGKPSWIGDAKPEYTASEVGALPSNTVIKINDNLITIGSDGVFDLGTISGDGEVVAGIKRIRVGSGDWSSTSDVTLPAYPTSLPASDVYSWAKASSKPSYTYSEVGAAAASHSHSNYGTSLYISGTTLYLRNGSTNLDYVTLPSSGGSSYSSGTGSEGKSNSTDKVWSASALNTFITSYGYKTTDSDTTYKLTLNGTQNGSGSTSLGSFYAPTASGSSGQVLTSGGSGYAPSWSNASGLSVGTASKLGSSTVGSSTKPVYLNGGTPMEGSQYAGGTEVTLNGSSKAGSTASFYAPVSAGTSNYVLTSGGSSSAPSWTAQSSLSVGSASKLASSRTVWGQSFDGSANISGAMSSVGTMTPSSTSSNIGSSSSRFGTLYNTAINTSGTATVGNLSSSGYVTALSDARKKDVKGGVVLDLDAIASAPSVRFLWKDREDDAEHVGTIAQYWQQALPEVVQPNADGTLSMDYSVAALVSVISLAKEVQTLKRIVMEQGRIISELKG